MEITLSYPLWYLLGVLLLSGGLAALLYVNNKKNKEVTKSVTGLLFTLRFLTLFTVLFLLLKPLIKHLSARIEKPIIAIAIDNSESIKMAVDSVKLQEVLNNISALKQQLELNYDVEMFHFSDEITTDKNTTFTGKTTNFSNLTNELLNVFANRNLGALFLLSDGINNRGSAPELAFEKLNVPVFTLGIGDTVPYRDSRISNVRNNQMAYVGNDFMVEFTIESEKLHNVQLQLEIINEGKIVYSKQIIPSSDRFFLKELVTLSATKTGVQLYEAVLKSGINEKNIINNRREFTIEVLDGKQRVLIVAGAPHPDIAAMRYALEENLNYEVNVSSGRVFNDKVGEYNLVILHQLPNAYSNLSSLLKQINETNTPVFITIGANTNFIKLNNAGFGFVIKPAGKNFQDALPAINQKFSFYQISNNFITAIPKLAPLKVPFGEYNFGQSFQSLLNQKIGPVETQQPLIAFGQNQNTKVGVIVGEGLWRWRMAAFNETESHIGFSQFFTQMVQFLATKDDKSRFRVLYPKLLTEAENVTFTVEVYDATYNLTNNEDVAITIFDENNNEFPFAFSRNLNTYYLNAGNFKPGQYQFTAQTVVDGKPAIHKGTFRINKIEVESVNLQANFNLLKVVAQSSGGSFFPVDSISQISEELNIQNLSKPIVYEELTFEELINLKWIFALILTWLTVEWVIRKRNGIY